MIERKINEIKDSLSKQYDLIMKMFSEIEFMLNEKKIENDLKNLEESVNKNEIAIEQRCIKVISLDSPHAKELRTILSMLRINTELEKIADLLFNILEPISYIVNSTETYKLINLPIMLEKVQEIVQKTLKAFMEENVYDAQTICKEDDVIDEMEEHIFRLVISYMISEPTTIKRGFNIYKVSKNLERVADCCTNICEETIYATEGKIIKHHNNEEN